LTSLTEFDAATDRQPRLPEPVIAPGPAVDYVARMTTCSAKRLVPGLALTLMLAAGCVPPPGAGDQSQAERYYNAGRSRIERQDFKGAVSAFEQALQADPGMIEAHFDLATVFDSELEAPAKALYHYVRVLELNPAFHGADLISNHLAAVKIKIAQDSLPGIPSPLLEKEIDRLQGELDALRNEHQRVLAMNSELNRQLASLRPTPGGGFVSPPEGALPEPHSPRLRTVPVESPRSTTLADVRGGSLPESGAGEGSSRTRTHVIQSGETLYALGRRFGVSVDEIIAANPGLNRNSYAAGTSIVIPVK
jgi:tetratricopeptide (TPR) repeat protein